MSDDEQPVPVDPARLGSGRWCHRAEKTLGQGDIDASYSADRIGTGRPVRKPFSWKGALWVCTSLDYRGGVTKARAYRLVPPDMFDGDPLGYAEKVADAEAARADPNGFYHGMTVQHAGSTFVLSGPQVTFVPGETEQPSLF